MDFQNKYRHEYKYQCSELQMAIIRSRLQSLLNYDKHAENGKYSIRSMYFDNYENRCYFENESGTDPREKFRVRIYNASDKRISLECKRKEKGKTYKTSCLITKEQYEELVTGANTMALEKKHWVLRKFSLLVKTQLFRPL